MGSNSYVNRSYRGKTGRVATPSWIGLSVNYIPHLETNSFGVLIEFYDFTIRIKIVFKNQFNDDNRRNLILKVTIDNVCKANTDPEQLKTRQNASVMLENFDSFCSNNAIIDGDFNLFLSKKLECKGGDPYLKKHWVSHVTRYLRLLTCAMFGELETRKQNHSISDKNIFLVFLSKE